MRVKLKIATILETAYCGDQFDFIMPLFRYKLKLQWPYYTLKLFLYSFQNKIQIGK